MHNPGPSNIPDGRRIQTGWGRIEHKGMPFNQMMLFPCDLTLRTTAEGVRLFCEPVKEIETCIKIIFMEQSDNVRGK